MLKRYLTDWRSHAFALLFILASEFIGIIPVTIGPAEWGIKFSLLPMLYVLVFGIILGATKVIPQKVMEQASPCVSIATMWLVAKLSTSIGPNLGAIVKAGPALLLQEFGNLGTIFLSVPIAVFVFKMGRQAVGAGFSNSREGSIALVGSMYGLDSPEGQGVMGAYFTGTILGTIFCGIMASLTAATGLFHPYSLAMAAGTGSASMMAAGMGPIIEAFPEMETEIQAYASTSNLLSTVDGLYLSLFLGIPLTRWLYKVLKGPERFQKAEIKRAEKRAAKLREKGIEPAPAAAPESTAPPAAPPVLSFKETWQYRGKVIVISGILMIIANWVNSFRGGSGTIVGPLSALPAFGFMLAAIVLGCLLFDLMAKVAPKLNLPAILYISVIGIILSIPGVPGANFLAQEMTKIGVLPMCTPVLAYAGVAIGKDLKSFRQQGLGIICTALMAFIGTYIGSAIIAQIVLSLTKVI